MIAYIHLYGLADTHVTCFTECSHNSKDKMSFVFMVYTSTSSKGVFVNLIYILPIRI